VQVSNKHFNERTPANL